MIRGSISLSQDSLPGFSSDYNVVMERFTLNDGASVLTLAQWRSTTGQDMHSIVATPAQVFLDPAANDYHLRADAPARDAGVTLADVTEDLEGTPRPGGPASDIGAFEIAGATSNATLSVTLSGAGRPPTVTLSGNKPLRMGCLAVSPNVVRPSGGRGRGLDFHRPMLEQVTRAEFLVEGHCARALLSQPRRSRRARVHIVAAIPGNGYGHIPG